VESDSRVFLYYPTLCNIMLVGSLGKRTPWKSHINFQHTLYYSNELLWGRWEKEPLGNHILTFNIHCIIAMNCCGVVGKKNPLEITPFCINFRIITYYAMNCCGVVGKKNPLEITPFCINLQHTLYYSILCNELLWGRWKRTPWNQVLVTYLSAYHA
jgi:hypothetical protein